MKRKIFVRIAKGTWRVEASTDSKARPIMTSRGKWAKDTYYPTIEIPIMLDIPDEAFPNSKKAIELKVEKYNLCENIEVYQDDKEIFEDRLEIEKTKLEEKRRTAKARNR